MRSAIAISALLGAGAFALPSLQHRHLHDKRHDNAEVVEVVELYTVTVTAGQELPTPEPEAPVVAPQKLAVKPVRPQPEPAAPIASPSSSAPPAASSSPAPAPVASAPQDSNSFWTTSPMSPMAGGSGAKDVLTQANYWRKQWKGLPPFTWSPALAKNAYLTATEPIFTTVNDKGETVKHNQGGAMEMNHNLNPGSNAQCIAGGNDAGVTQDLTPFEHAYLMWICEMPTAGIQATCDSIQKPSNNPGTGHAEIIAGKYSQIGCYYMDSVQQKDPNHPGGMWTCDFTS